MAFVKLVKNKAYFMRYQTKFRRRHQGKTDYFAWKRLVIQDKDKYNTPKYRLAVRFTSTRVLAQVVYSTIQGDKVFTSTDSNELRRFGLTAGLTNYASAYSTGLLVARRLLKKVGLYTTYAGNTAIEKHYDADADQKDRRPFKVILDVGLKSTSTGSKVFAVLKGVVTEEFTLLTLNLDSLASTRTSLMRTTKFLEKEFLEVTSTNTWRHLRELKKKPSNSRDGSNAWRLQELNQLKISTKRSTLKSERILIIKRELLKLTPRENIPNTTRRD